jgi:hypothetical protein
MFAGAHAVEVLDDTERHRGWQLLRERHPNLVPYELPNSSEAAVIHARCRYVSIVDYTKGLGHTEEFTVEG